MTFQTVLCADQQAAAEACGRQMLEILFQFLAGSGFDWSRVHLFWVDERAVPPGDPQSNYTLAHDNWLEAVGFPAANIHRIHAELPVSDAVALAASSTA